MKKTQKAIRVLGLPESFWIVKYPETDDSIGNILLLVTFRQFIALAIEEANSDFLFGIYSEEDEEKAREDAHELLRRSK